ncbi:MAG: hypothetical protein JWM10_1033 [Myxococcaceae bacterium]|nr:hypothetical protein [Myxococcaceae bacterium]
MGEDAAAFPTDLDGLLRIVVGDPDAERATAAAWAAPFADLLTSLRSPDGPRARAEVRGYGMLGLYQWDVLGLLTALPLVRAGVPIEARWDVILPFWGDALGREVLLAIPADRREAFVYRRLMTDWGPTGAMALNGFDAGFPLLDLAPSERVTRVLVGKLRNNRGYFKKRKDRILARFDELAAEHPGVAAGLKPRRAPPKKQS